MADPTDNEDELNGAAQRAEQDNSGKGKTGKSGGDARAPKLFLTEDEEEEIRRKRRGDSGEGDQDSFGRGKAGAASGIRLSPPKLKEVMADWRHLDMGAAIAAFAEFFTEGPMRASANAVVTWVANKSFAIVNWALSAGEKAAQDLALKTDNNRETARDARGLQRQKMPAGMTMTHGPAGPTGAGQ